MIRAGSALLSIICYGLLGVVAILVPTAVACGVAALVGGGAFGLAAAIAAVVPIAYWWCAFVVTVVWWVKTGVWSWRLRASRREGR